MRALFLGKNKRSAARALDWLVEQGCEVPAVVAAEPDEWTHPEQRLDRVAERHGLRLTTDDELYESPPEDVDLVLSFLFWKRIRPPLIELPSVGCLNFHPAPLPDMRGVGGYNVAILEGRRDWGVSCHFVDPEFDTGDLVQVERFELDADSATALSLDIESQERLLALFKRVVGRALAGEELPREPQGEGRYVSRDELERMRRVEPGDDVDRKLRAFWYPPWPGATVSVDGRELTLMDDERLGEVARAYRDSGRIP
ncbi:MAG TPA: formyltransferase family protein [Thermoleophilaceae bacterium]